MVVLVKNKKGVKNRKDKSYKNKFKNHVSRLISYIYQTHRYAVIN